MTFDRNIPYNDLPPLPPLGIELETKAVLKKAITANTALAKLNDSGKLIPNQSVLIQAIGLQEAKLSSEIENIVTTNDDLYRAFADEGVDQGGTAKEVLYYKDALWSGYNAIKQEGRPLSTRLFEDIFRIIKRSNDGVRRLSGTKLTNPAGEIIYTPPEGESIIRDKLANLESFLYAEDDLDPLVKMAIMHYQFEAIHPFPDGNGRTGRILNILYLNQCGILDIPVLYLSRYIIENKADYYTNLRGVTENGEWEPWILYMLEAIETTAQTTRERILSIRSLMDETQKRIRAVDPKLGSTDLIEVIFRQPYCKIKFLEEAGIAQRQTASVYLSKLEEMGVLTSIKVGREKYYINKAFFDLLAR
ncbi:MAG: Fic family protein [Alphaproteobacteria bacterium]|nr:Fic family protein [Alphaproteobacteria bacterium]